MRNLLREIHRRSLWQVLGVYLAASWIVLQVVDVIGNNFGLPEWVPPAALVLLLLGLPIVVGTAFVQEGVPRAAAEPPSPAEAGGSGSEAGGSRPAATDERATARDRDGAHQRLLTWRNALLGGVAAFALLGIATAGYMAMRTLGIGPAATLVAAGVLDERDPILIAEFESGSGDTILARTATEALRTDIAETSIVTVYSADQVADALERMRRDPDGRLDLELAREVAQREGIKAVITGEVNAAGAGYVLTARVVSAEDGTVLASRRESAADETAIIDAIDRLSRGLRERLGESLRSVQSSPPLARLTTGSIEALRLFQEGNRALGEGDREGGLRLLYEAVAIDTAFAAAWRRIATELGNPGNPAEARAREIEAATKGYLHRDRLTEYERVRAEAIYHRAVTGDYEREQAVYERAIERWPEATAFHNNLAVGLIDREEFERAERVVRQGMAVQGSDVEGSSIADFFLSVNLVGSLIGQGSLEEADSLAGVFAPAFPATDFFRAWAPMVTSVSRADWSRLDAFADSARAGAREDAPLIAATLRGRTAAVRETLERSMEEAERASSPANYLEAAIALATFDARVRRDPETARRTLDEALARHPLETVDPFSRPYGGLIEALALLGRIDAARDLLGEYEAEVIEPLGIVWREDWHRARSELALAEGRPRDAIAEQRLAEAPSPCRTRCPELARAYDLAGQPDSALALYTRFAESPAGANLELEARNLAPALERLGQLYDERGDLENAARYYARFVELWAEADPELQPRVQAAQQRLEAILRERG